MIYFKQIEKNYLEDLVSFLNSVKWMFVSLNTQYIKENVIVQNKQVLESLTKINLSNFPELENPQKDHPECLQKLITDVNRFKISFDTIATESRKSTALKKMSPKKQYEIENFSEVIDNVCAGDVTQLIDFGSGLGYLSHYLFDKFGYSVLGLECGDDRVEKANERQVKLHPKSCGKVKHVQHFVTLDSEEFILSQLDDNKAPLAIFGLHGCGDLTVTAIKLFLNMSQAKKLVFMPCCYHKMSAENDSDFNFFPLSDELKAISQNYPPFMNRPFLRLAGQQSPAKWKEMSESDHWIHGKNMFERALVEALLAEDETIKRVSNITFPDDQVTMNDIKLKYQLLEKSNGNSKEWNERHQQRFLEYRQTYEDGEEMSENLFCLQTTLQNNCENLVLVDRVRYIQEEAARRHQTLGVSVKKLQDDKLSPRCLILIVEKC